MAAKVKALQAWCKAQCDGYRDVEIRNMTSSWKSGLAFCALIHRYRPDLIDYDSLSKENVFENNQLAFTIAERELNIPALLDAEDMVAMAVPDKLCIVTYVAQYYNRLGNKEKLGGPGVKGKAAVKRPSADNTPATDVKKPLTTQPLKTDSLPKTARRGSSLGDLCAICSQKVYVMERHMDGNRLYHRRCIREQQRSQRSPTRTSLSPSRDKHKQTFSFDSEKTSGGGKENRKPVEKSRFGGGGFGNNPAVNSRFNNKLTNQSAVTTTTSHVSHVGTKPLVSMATASPTTTTSSQLFTKLHSAPKPYTSTAFSSDPITSSSGQGSPSLAKSTASPRTTTGFKSPDSDVSKSTGSTSLATNKPKFGAKFYGNKNENPLLKKSLAKNPPHVNAEAMDTSEQCEEGGQNVHKPQEYSANGSHNVVTAKTYDGSQPMTAHVTKSQVHTAGGPAEDGGESQVLQGLLKNLAGVRNRAGPLSPPSAPTAKSSARDEDKPEFTKMNLKSTPHSDAPPLPKQPPPMTSPTESITSRTEQVTSPISRNKHDIPKPKQRTSKLIAESAKVDPKEENKWSHTHVSKYEQETKDLRNGHSQSPSSQPHELSNTTTPADVPHGSPKSILKKKADSKPANENSTPLFMQKASPWSPPLSVFTPSKDSKSGLLDSVQLDSSDEFESKWDKSPVKKPFVSPTVPARPHTSSPAIDKSHSNVRSASPKAGADSRTAPKNNSDITNSNSATASQLNNEKTKNKTPPKSSWQIELEARQGIRQHQAKAGVKAGVKDGVKAAYGKKQQVQHDMKTASDNDTKDSRPSWQDEAKRRQEKRREEENMETDDSHSSPIAPPRRKPPPRPTSPPKFHSSAIGDGEKKTPPPLPKTGPVGTPSHSGVHENKQVQMGSDTSQNGEKPNYIRASVTSDEDPFGRTSKPRTSGGVGRKPAFRVDGNSPPSNQKTVDSTKEAFSSSDDRPEWVIEAEKRKEARKDGYVDPEKEPQKAKKKIVPDQRFTFSYDFESPVDEEAPCRLGGEVNGRISPPLVAPEQWNGDMSKRPLPELPRQSPVKRRVHAEDRMAVHEIVEQLEHLDAALQVCERDGRVLEDKIRQCTDESMDENELMVQWFELVNQKNELVRKETDLMFRKKQQELEDEHEDIEYELRCLLTKPDHLKTPSEKVREESLLQELMDTVSLRNSIVDTIEQNRIRYIEEDEEIASVMSMRGFCSQPSVNEEEGEKDTPVKKKGKKKHRKRKDKKHHEAQQSESSHFYCQ